MELDSFLPEGEKPEVSLDDFVEEKKNTPVNEVAHSGGLAIQYAPLEDSEAFKAIFGQVSTGDFRGVFAEVDRYNAEYNQQIQGTFYEGLTDFIEGDREPLLLAASQASLLVLSES